MERCLSQNSNGGMGSVRFGRPSRNDRYLREAAGWNRRISLKNPQIEQLQKSRSGAHNVV
jgi:hypothetical protein